MVDQRRTIEFAPSPNPGAQSAFLRSEDLYPYLTMGFGGGKTWGGKQRLLKGHLSHPGVNSLGVEPTVQLLRQIMIPALTEAIEAIGLKCEPRLGADDIQIRTPELRSTILLHSGSKAERITGFEVGQAWIDEPARIPDFEPRRNVWKNVLARVRDPRVPPNERTVSLTGTHEGKGTWVWRDWEANPKPGHVVFRGSTFENPTSVEYAEELTREYGHDLAMQYVRGMAVDESASAIAYSVLEGLQDGSCRRDPDWARLQSAPYPLFAGMDIGRKKSLTVVWVWMRDPVSGRLTTESVFELREVPFAEQQDLIRRLSTLPMLMGLAIDATYNYQTSEDAIKEHGALIDPVIFTSRMKLELADRIIGLAQEGLIRIPFGDDILADFNSVKRVVTGGGVVKYEAPFSADGHADRFWAAALGLRATGVEAGPLTCAVGPSIMARAGAW